MNLEINTIWDLQGNLQQQTEIQISQIMLRSGESQRAFAWGQILIQTDCMTKTDSALCPGNTELNLF